MAKEFDEENNEIHYWLLTTGAYKKANVYNIYDMAGNLGEMTMEGHSDLKQVVRGRFLVTGRECYGPGEFSVVGFRPSLYIKVK